MGAFKKKGRVKTCFLNASITEKMERVREILRKFGILNDTFPYQPELSRHAVVVAPLSCVFFLFFDIMHTLKDDNSIVWWSVHVGLLGFFSLFLHPLIWKPSYSNLSKWYVSWLFVALVYHLPSSQSVAISIRMNLSLFLTIFIFSIVCLLVFHYIFILVEYIFSCQNRKLPDIWTVLQFSAVVSIACCVFLSHCRERPLEQRNLKDKVCSSLFCMRDENCGTIYDLYAKAASSSDEISLIYSCWVTFIGLYIANYVAERSSESGEKYKKNRQTKPDFLDMVPWYSGTSADLYKTVFDLKVSANVFLSRFDLRVFQTAMKKNQLVPKKETQRDYLHDDFSAKKELWFDFIADTGDGGNSTYTMARLLAQQKIKIDPSQKDEYKIDLDTLKRGDFSSLGGILRKLTIPFYDYNMTI